MQISHSNKTNRVRRTKSLPSSVRLVGREVEGGIVQRGEDGFPDGIKVSLSLCRQQM